MKFTSTLCTAMLALLLSGNAMAQQPLSSKGNMRERMERFSLAHGMSLGETPFSSSALPAKAKKRNLPRKTVRPLYTAIDGTSFYGVVTYRDAWMEDYNFLYGVYSINTTSSDWTSIYTSPDLDASGGASFFNGLLHTISVGQDEDGNMFGSYFEFEMSDWSLVKTKTLTYSELLQFFCHANDYDPTTGLVYACVNSADESGYALAKIDYTSMTSTEIANLPQMFYALAVNSQGRLYGIGEDGILYSINKETGETTEIGSTGIVPDAYQSATFDRQTDRLYWSAVSSASNIYGLYEVDTTTGAATALVNYPEGMQVKGLFAYVPFTDDIPARINALTASFPNGALNGTVSFTMPTRTLQGNDITTSNTYVVTVNGEEAARGKAAAGAQVNVSVAAPNGTATFVAWTENAEGKSRQTETSMWVGPDIPADPTGVTLANNDQVATLSWTAPEEGLHGGYVNPGNLTYRIVRYPDSTVVAPAAKGTRWTEPITAEQPVAYQYGITAINGTQQSNEVLTGFAVFGDAFQVPYLEDFEDPNSFNLFSVIDANGDGFTWDYMWHQGFNPTAAVGLFEGGIVQKDADDWIISPNVKLDPNYVYEISFKAWSRGGKERLVAGIGQGMDTTQYDMIFPLTEITAQMDNDYAHPQVLKQNFRPTTAGNYNIGIHGVSTKHDGVYLAIDELQVKSLGKSTSPDSVTQLAVTPEAEGGSSATISFCAPAKSIGGEDLKTITKIELVRDDNEIVKTWNHPTPGQQLTYIDEDLPNGAVKYTVTPYNEDGNGVYAERSVFVGFDVPLAPAGLVLKDTEYGLRVEWQTPGAVGTHGGYVDPETMTYTLYRIETDDDYYHTAYPVASAFQETSYDLNSDDIVNGTQKLLSFGVKATGDAGDGEMAQSNEMVVGMAHGLPFKETFTSYNCDNTGWWRKGDDRDNLIDYQSKISADEGSGAALWKPTLTSHYAILNSGKIALGDAAAPKLSFSYYGTVYNNATIEVSALRNGTDSVYLGTIAAGRSESEGWHEAQYDLKALKGSRYIILRFRLNSTNTWVQMGLDRIQVRNVLNTDLLSSVSAPATAQAGRAANISVTVENNGVEKSGDYTVSLYDGDKLVETRYGTALAALTDTVFQFAYAAPVTNAQAVFTADVAADNDEDETNNISAPVTTRLYKSEYTAPANLEAKETESGVGLSWVAPDTKPQLVTDGFENYANGEEQFGQWVTRDFDKGQIYGIGSYTIPHHHAALAFQVLNPEECNFNLERSPMFAAHGGSQYAMAESSEPSTILGDHNDDWLISPELSGNKQTISFYASTFDKEYKERLEVLYSTTTTDTSAFAVLADTTITIGGWNEYSYELPQGARYFAIRYLSRNKYVLLVDDVTYEQKTLTLVGYNIYRDGKLIATLSDKTTTVYTDNDAGDGTGVYNVTALYAEGESAFSNDAFTAFAGITGAALNEATADKVYTVGGVAVSKRARKHLPSGIYIVDGKKVVVK